MSYRVTCSQNANEMDMQWKSEHWEMKEDGESNCFILQTFLWEPKVQHVVLFSKHLLVFDLTRFLQIVLVVSTVSGFAYVELFVSVGVGTFTFMPDCDKNCLMTVQRSKMDQRDPGVIMCGPHMETCNFFSTCMPFTSMLFNCIKTLLHNFACMYTWRLHLIYNANHFELTMPHNSIAIRYQKYVFSSHIALNEWKKFYLIKPQLDAYSKQWHFVCYWKNFLRPRWHIIKMFAKYYVMTWHNNLNKLKHIHLN